MEANEGDGPTLTSPAAFVEGGTQDVYEDACSICLEEFSEADPSTVTKCRHEFHLHCILEWCQRSSQCPMCWQSIRLKDPLSQEFFEGVEQERNIRAIASSRATIFQNTNPQDFEFGRLGIGINEPELEQRILLHLATVAGMGSVHRGSRRESLRVAGRRESSRGQLSTQGRSHYSAFPSHPGEPESRPVSSPSTRIEGETETITGTASQSVALTSGDERVPPNTGLASAQTNQMPISSSMSAPATRRGFSFTHRSTSSYPSSSYQDGGGSSEFPSFSGSFKARFNEASMRYKETISRTTRDLKERLFSRNSSMSGLGSGVIGEITTGIATASRIVERLETKNGRMNQTFTSNQSAAEHTESEGNKMHSEGIHWGNPRNDRSSATSSSTSKYSC